MDLRKLVKVRGPLPAPEAAHIIRQAALGLAYAHDKGLIHRDVKPGNILVTPTGEAKVSDVGLAGFNKDLLDDPRAGKIVGTTDYISPEQIRTPLEIKPTADIYSLGCTLYYAVCGKVPFPGGDTHSKLRRHLEDTPWHPRRFVPDIPEDFVDIIAEMMDKHPEKRIQTAAEVAARLEPWADYRGASQSTARLTRSPWMAPPPPLDAGLDSSDAADDPLQESSIAGSQPSSFQTGTGSGSPFDVARPGRDSAPPLHPYTSVPITNSSNGNSSSSSGSNSNSSSMGSKLVELDRMSPWMIVALTLAIAIPPALVIGAILGYVLSQR